MIATGIALLAAAVAQPVPDPIPQAGLIPPKLLESTPPRYPPGKEGTARVVLQLDVDEQGKPGKLAVLSPPQPGFDESALAAAENLRFAPATQGGKPVAVRIQYAFNFLPPPLPPQPVARPVNFSGVVRERGTRRKLGGIEISAGGQPAITAADGRFEIRGLPEGVPLEVLIAAPGYERFTARTLSLLWPRSDSLD